MLAIRWTIGFVALAFSVVAACGSDDGGGDGAGGTAGSSGTGGQSSNGFIGSCDTRTKVGPSEGQCRDWSGNSNVDVEVSCNGLDGTFSGSTPCPSDSRVGRCTLEPVLDVSAVYNYYAPKYTEASAQDHCTDLSGTFSAG